MSCIKAHWRFDYGMIRRVIPRSMVEDAEGLIPGELVRFGSTLREMPLGIVLSVILGVSPLVDDQLVTVCWAWDPDSNGDLDFFGKAFR